MASSIDDLLSGSSPSVTEGTDEIRVESVAVLNRLEAVPQRLLARRWRRPMLLAAIAAAGVAGIFIPVLAGSVRDSSGTGPVPACAPTFQAVTSRVDDAQGSAGGPEAISRANTYLRDLNVARLLKSPDYQRALGRAEAQQGSAGGASPSESALLSVVSAKTAATLTRAGFDPAVVRVVAATTCP